MKTWLRRDLCSPQDRPLAYTEGQIGSLDGKWVKHLMSLSELELLEHATRLYSHME